MWNQWSRWWRGDGAAGEGLPEKSATRTEESENSTSARSEIGERVEAAQESTLPVDLDAHTAAHDARADFSSASDRLIAGDRSEDATDEIEGASTFPDLDPVADLRRRGLELPAGRSRARRGRRLARPEDMKPVAYSPEQRLMILDCWRRSGLPAKDFATLVGVSKHTLYAWKQRFTREGPAGLMEQSRGAPEGSRLPELTKRTILMLKEAHPDWGCERISQMLQRGPALPASPPAVVRVLREAGYELQDIPTHPHPDKIRFFERAKPNQLWQTDLFTFVLRRQNRRVYLVAFLDDHSRYLVSFGLHASQSTALVLEVFRAGITAYRAPEEVLTDNGSQYVTWRGESAFQKELKQRGIRQIVAAPRHPQTLGKLERFWGTLWREFLESAVFLDLADARARIGHFIDWYNFQRTHSGVGGLVPADRFFGAAPEVLQTLKDRVASNALELARNGLPKPPFYMTGQVGGKNFSLHAEGERVFLTREGDARQEVDLVPRAATEDLASMPKAVCPDGSPAAESFGPAPAISHEGLTPIPSFPALDEDVVAGQEGELP
jgi:transposase InsO family protein